MTPQEQVRAARIATVIVGAMAITIGIAAKGQNVAHLVALAFAVAASANFPCVLLTLYWKRCNTGGIVLGMIVGTLTAIGLVLVSPNMTYPLAVKAAQEKVVDGAARDASAKLDGRPRRRDRRRRRRTRLKAAIAKAREGQGRGRRRKIEGDQGQRHARRSSGLEKPLFELRNPGLISIPLGFLAVILGSLLYRDKRAEDMWDELYVRQNTGILPRRPRRTDRRALDGNARTPASRGGFCLRCGALLSVTLSAMTHRAPPPRVVDATREFLRRHAPFNRMSDAALAFARPAADARVLREGRDDPRRPQTRARSRTCTSSSAGWSAAARTTRRPIPTARSGPGELFPVGALSAGGTTTKVFTALQDTFCYLLPRDDFLELRRQSPEFERYCTQAITETLKQSLASLHGQYSQRAAEQQTLDAHAGRARAPARR